MKSYIFRHDIGQAHMRFHLLPLLTLLLCTITELNGQVQETKAIKDGTYKISYKLGSGYELTIKGDRYTRVSDSGESQKGVISIDENSFTLYPDKPKIEKKMTTSVIKINRSGTNETQLIAKNPISNLLQLPPCNWHELNRPNRKSSKFIVYSLGGIRIQCARGRISRLRNK